MILERLIYKIYRRIVSIIEKEKDKISKDKCLAGGNTIFFYESRLSNLSGVRSNITIGKHTCVRGHILVYPYAGRITIGDYCYVGEGTNIWSAKSITIGNRVLIAHNVDVHDSNDHPTDSNERHEHYKSIITKGFPDINMNERPIIIEDDVWIGFGSAIMKGVTIGKGSIVAAHSVVVHDVPEGVVVAGNPAKIVKYLDKGSNR